MTKTRSPYQLELALPMPSRGEAPRREVQEVEAVTATAEPESPASTEHLMEAICAPDNIEAALRAVVRNKGAPGIDGITVNSCRASSKRAGPAQGPRTVGQCGYLQPKGTVAAELLGSSASRLHQSPLPSSGAAFHGKAGKCLIRRTAVVRTRMPGGVGGAASRDVPLSRLTESTVLPLCPGGTAPL